MAINQDDSHPAHLVSKYFEIMGMTYPTLFLLTPREDAMGLSVEQKKSIKISESGGHEKKTSGRDNKQQREEKLKKQSQKDKKSFLNKYPGQQKYDISDVKAEIEAS